MNMLKRSLAMMLVLCMLISYVPFNAFASEDGTETPVAPVAETEEVVETTVATVPPTTEETVPPTTEETVPPTTVETVPETTEETVPETTEETYPQLTMGSLTFVVPGVAEQNEAEAQSADVTYKILHLDAGRKYFTADWIKALITEMKAAGYNQLQLAFGNDGLRFLLDDMTFTANGTTYTHETVVSKVEAGNEAQNSSGDKSWLTQTEMDAIIAHANSKGIEIVPLLNLPGHANAILDIVDDAYNASGSDNTLNVASSAEAQAFGMAILKKYVDYFAGKGCKFFSFGADEYANDASGTFSFGRLSSAEYAEFVSFVNDMVAYIESKGMTPRAFNDGLYYNNQSVTMDTDIQCCYWSSGWSGYNLASASTISGKGHPMINTHGDYYYVLGKTDTWDNNGYTAATGFDVTQFSKYTGYSWTNETISNPVGAMFCIWCDYPNTESETTVAANARMVLRAMAAEMSGNDGSAVSTDVVTGGFNADGSINGYTGGSGSGSEGSEGTESTESVTLTENTVSVTAVGLTGLTVTEAEAPVIEGAAEVKAWNMVPVTADGAYVGEAKVAVPVPAGWNTGKMGAFVVNADNTVTLIAGAVNADGNYEFTMPHFSVGGVYYTATAAEGQDTVTSSGGTASSYVLDTDDLDVNAQYLIVRENNALTNTKGSLAVTISGNNATPIGDASAALWTYSADYNNYVGYYNKTLSNGDNYLYTSITGRYPNYQYVLNINDSDYTLTITSNNDGTYTVLRRSSSTNVYVAYDDGWGAQTDSQNLSFYKYTAGTQSFSVDAALQESRIAELTVENDGYTDESWAAYQSALTAAQNKLTTVEGTPYTSKTDADTALDELIADVDALEAAKNALAKAVVITINYVDADGKTVMTETKNVADNATSIALTSPIYDSSDNRYTFTQTTLELKLPDTITYSVTVVSSPADLDDVDPLTVEYWITNQVVTINGVNSETISVAEAHSAAGVALDKLVPATDGAADKPKVLWKGWILPSGYHQEDNGGQDMTSNENGKLMTKIRYWNEAWQAFDGTNWYSIKSTDQVVAYYMQQTAVTQEVTTNVVDWGEPYSDWKAGTGASWFWDGYVESGTKYIFLDFAVVYEEGTQNPSAFPTDNTWFLHFDGHSATNPRVLNPITFTDNENYEIWKVTVTDGTSTGYTSASDFESTYDDDTETVVWDEKMGGQPMIADLTYTANRSGKLVRVYVRSVAADSVTVHYMDEQFDAEFYKYSIGVKENVTFDKGFAMGTEKNTLINNTVKNHLDVTLTVSADLTTMTEIGAQYRYSNFELVSVSFGKNEDGTTDYKNVYLYYIFTPVSYFVADFGLPIDIKPSDLDPQLTDSIVSSIELSDTNTNYGELSVNSTTKTLTYTPTEVLEAVDGFTMLIKTTGSVTIEGAGDNQVAFRVYIVPATSVYYEAGFLKNYVGSWTYEGTVSAKKQTTEKLYGKQYAFGYLPEYDTNGQDAVTSTIGAEASFEFTGNGFEVFVNSATSSGYLIAELKDSAGAVQKVYMVNTVAASGDTDATTGQNTNLKALPAVRIIDTGLTHGEYTVTLKKLMDSKPVNIDGFRIFNTLEDSTGFTKDEEDNPLFYELRDTVLYALGINNDTSADYKTMIDQVYNKTTGAAAIITDESVTYGSSETLQDLLDNGPKNELFLRAGQTLTFNVKTARKMQLGMKAPTGTTSYQVTCTDTNTISGSIATPIDMFYDLGNARGTEKTYTVSVKNTGSNILSVTLLKICDDPSFAFQPLTVGDIEGILQNAGYTNSGSGETTEPETPVEPELPIIPETPVEPEVPEEPEVVYADAKLTVNLVDYRGKKQASTELTMNGEEGTDAVFSAEAILEAAEAKMPKKYSFVNESAVEDVTVTYGDDATVTVKVGKVATLKVTYINLFGRAKGNVTLTKVQNGNGNARFTAAEIKAAAPKGYRVLVGMNVPVSYGSTKSALVTVW